MRHSHAALFALSALAALAPAARAQDATPMEGIAIYGEPKYKPGFAHYDYVNPDAPKGGELRQADIGAFDSLNPFIIKGQAAAEAALPFETLLTGSADEPFTEYGLIAASVEFPPDRSWEIFNLRPQARFQDNSPITADDVVFSFDILKDKGAPLYRFYYQAVSKAEALDPHRVKFTFSGNNRELPLIMGQLPVLSKAYYTAHKFDETTLVPPLGSGPYKIAGVDAPRSITLERLPDYWGKDLAVNRGLNNFDRMRFDYYRDATVAIEAIKAGAYDLRVENISKNWATSYDVPSVKDGHLILKSFANERPTGLQGFAYNLRRPLFQNDKIRAALAYAFDFEWTNAHLFFGQYKRTESYFSNSELASSGLPSPAELKLLEPLKADIPPEVFTQTYAPPKTDGSGNLRDNLRAALALLKDAGWTVKDGKMVDAGGKQMSFEFLLDDPSFERVILPFVQNLQRLGIDARVRTVDSAQYKYRLDHFDYDMVVGLWGQSDSPGNEQREFWGSAAADEPGSQNVVGIKNKAIDSLVASLVAAPDRESLVAACRALDRVLLWNHYVIPNWYLGADRIVYWDKFGMPDVVPTQGVQIMSWWIDPPKAAKVAPFLKN
jgi:microcin C transport system substrate-binding protein